MHTILRHSLVYLFSFISSFFQSQAGKSSFLKYATEFFCPILSTKPLAGIVYVGAETLDKNYASALRTIANNLNISVHFFSGGVMSPSFQTSFIKAVKRRSRTDAQASPLDDNNKSNDDDDDDDDDNNDNENIGEDEGDSQKYLQRKEVLHNGKKGDISEECINFYRRMCEKRHGKYRTPAKSARPTEWSSTPKLLNKRPRMGSIKKMKKTLMSSRGHSDREGKQTGAGIMTRAAKRRLEALEQENAAASSNTAAAIMSNDKMTAAKEAVEKSKTFSNATVSSARVDKLLHQNPRDLKLPKKGMMKAKEGTTAAMENLEEKSDNATSLHENDITVEESQEKCDFKPDTLIIGDIALQCDMIQKHAPQTNTYTDTQTHRHIQTEI